MGKVTVTEFETEDRCGWRWDFNSFNRLAIEPILPLKALFIGTLVHKALDMLSSTLLIKAQHTYYNPFGGNAPCGHEYADGTCCNLPAAAHATGTAIYDMYAWDKLNAITKNYTEKVGAPPNSYEMREILDSIDLGRAMFGNYLNYYKTPLPDDFEYISTEQSVLLELPDTEHCECAYHTDCQCSVKDITYGSCRPYNIPVHYTHCMCVGKTCPCRQSHQLEATIDGLVRRKTDGWRFILENKTFTYHPTRTSTGRYPEFERNHQFMGYTWAGQAAELEPKGILYNGLWKRAELPNKRTWEDMFLRTTIPYQSYEIDEWQRQASRHAMRMLEPGREVERYVHPVGGCKGLNGCSFNDLCDARFKNINYQTLLKTKYQPRERTSIFEDDVVAE